MLVLCNLPVTKHCFLLVNNVQREKKKNRHNEHRVFDSEWTNKYLFATNKDKIICLVCRETAAVPKEYNLRQHLETQHPTIAK